MDQNNTPSKSKWGWYLIIIIVIALVAVASIIVLSTKQTPAPVISSQKVAPTAQNTHISPMVSQDFPISDIKNIGDMEKAYGFTFTPGELQQLSQNKFVVKNILDTNLSKNVAV